MIEALLKPTLSALGGLVSLVLNRPQLRILCNWQHYPNGDEIGNYLGLAIKIANTGAKPLYFERLELIRRNGDSYYPTFMGASPGTEIKPNASLVGHIPAGHVANQQVVELRVFDAVERVFRLRGRKLLGSVGSLEQEQQRLEQLGFKVHPTSGTSSSSVAG